MRIKLRKPAANNEKENAKAKAMTANAVSLYRSQLLQKLLGTTRDIDAECGYPEKITPDDYHSKYDRDGIAARTVDVLPEESWSVDPEITEDADPSNQTEFEMAWTELEDRLHVLSVLERLDKLSGVGRYGVLLLGLDDGKDLGEAVEGINERGGRVGNLEHQLIYVRAFEESVAEIKATESDSANPRYGRPTRYSISFSGETSSSTLFRTKEVHWSRVLHVADNRQMSDVYGTPRMQKVYNRLLDIHKVLSGSGEMFWKGAFPGYSFEVAGEDGDVQLDTDSLRDEMDNYMNGLQRYLALSGVSVKSLAPQVVDPKGHLQSQLDAIAVALGIPKRILFGSEQSQLASAQDMKTWYRRLARRQEKYITPMIIRPFIDRLIVLGCLPEPSDGYRVVWQDLMTASDAEKAEKAEKWAQALAKYVAGGAEAVVAPDEFLAIFGGLDLEQIQQIKDGVEQTLLGERP